jgi:hypothetical protein
VLVMARGMARRAADQVMGGAGGGSAAELEALRALCQRLRAAADERAGPAEDLDAVGGRQAQPQSISQDRSREGPVGGRGWLPFRVGARPAPALSNCPVDRAGEGLWDGWPLSCHISGWLDVDVSWYLCGWAGEHPQSPTHPPTHPLTHPLTIFSAAPSAYAALR